MPLVPFYTPLSINSAFHVFRGYRKKAVAWKGLKETKYEGETFLENYLISAPKRACWKIPQFYFLFFEFSFTHLSFIWFDMPTSMIFEGDWDDALAYS